MRYTREDGCRAWLTCGRMPYDVLKGLMADYGAAEAVYDRFCAGDTELKERLPVPSVEALQTWSCQEQLHKLMLTMQRHAMGIVYLDDYAYPEELHNLADAPVLLYYQGDLQCLNNRCITMVGSRNASLAGLKAAEDIAGELARSGVCVVSGMANGIDAASHWGCIRAGGCSAGVVACGLDVDYPRDSGELRRAMLDSGGVLLSEYAPGVPARNYHFPVRNRILAGLSRGTVMVECRLRSGSMTTVQHALDQGRDVFAWPGAPGTEWAEGAHQLIREGARYMTCARDILEDLDWLSLCPPTRDQVASLPPLTQEQKQVYLLIRRGAQSMDALAMESGMDTPALTSTLTMLQLLGLVRSEPGKTYSIV